MTLEEIIDAHKATFSIKLARQSDYDEYYAHISFADGNIAVEINDAELGRWGDQYDAMPYAWIEQITKLVNDLKDAKIIPNYTLSLVPEA